MAEDFTAETGLAETGLVELALVPGLVSPMVDPDFDATDGVILDGIWMT